MSDVARIYQDGSYAEKNPFFGDDNAEWKISNAVDFCKRLQIPASRLAEVGCGGGAILIGVAERLGAKEAVGYEPMPEAFQHAKPRENSRRLFAAGVGRPERGLRVPQHPFRAVQNGSPYFRQIIFVLEFNQPSATPFPAACLQVDAVKSP